MNTARRLITVFGATGRQGGGLARAILADPQRRFRVRAVTRKPESPAASALEQAGAEIVVADLDDDDSVLRAMQGAYGAFCVTSSWELMSPERELAQARRLADCAQLAQLAHVIWSTLEDTRDFVPADGARMPVLGGRYNVPHYDAKGEANAYFFERRVPVTLLYTSFHWDNLIHFGMQPRRAADGTLEFVLPMDDARLPGIAAGDIGPCAFALFARQLDGDDCIGKSIGIAGEHLSGVQMAEQLALALGEPVRHARLSPAEYRSLGFPGADHLGNMFQFKRDFEHAYRAARAPECARQLHPGLQSFATWLAAQRRHIAVAPVPAAARSA